MSTWRIPRMRDTLRDRFSVAACSPSFRLPALVLAWTLALLTAPALASASCALGAAGYTGASGGNWSDGANWSTASAPTLNQTACIPTGESVVVDVATAQAGSLVVESGAGLTIDPGQKLLVGGGTIGLDSALAGTITVNGTLDMKQ